MARRRSYRSRSRKASSRIGSTGKKVMIGLGAAALGGIIANMVGINKTIPALALGYFGAGATGAVTAVASDMLQGGTFGNLFGLRAGSSTPAGTVYS
jgi:hypothetical protein